MKTFGKLISTLLVLCTVVQLSVFPARALDSSVSAYDEGGTSTVVIQIKPKSKTTSRSNAAAAPQQAGVQTEEAEYERKEYDAVPLYFQTDYPDTMYGSGTVASGGCSVTALAMVATYLTGYEYLPNELAYYFGGRAENNTERLLLGSEAMGLPYEELKNWHFVVDALKKDKIVIILMNNKSILTDSQHFLVLTEITEDGLIMVHDPYEPNYDRWDLKRAFVEGFTEEDLCWGFDGAWAYDKDDIPSDIERYTQQLPNQDGSKSRYKDIQLTVEEKQLLAKVVWVEARGECAEGQQAVAEVILNRLASGEYGSSLSGVIFDEGQFRSAAFLDEATPYQAQYMAVEGALNGPYILPKSVMHFATYPATTKVWGEIGGHIFCYDWDWVPGSDEEDEEEQTEETEAPEEETLPAETLPGSEKPERPARPAPEETTPRATESVEME
ncbi:MAG: cell wall hydrolase [Oscillospiraceae bacterium]|nr:cell wall hydrolase [Oscillospiraceae bacterium]MBQ7130582.1 cell wall hydrolase [Oscillospiraceae bacterium]